MYGCIDARELLKFKTRERFATTRNGFRLKCFNFILKLIYSSSVASEMSLIVVKALHAIRPSRSAPNMQNIPIYVRDPWSRSTDAPFTHPPIYVRMFESSLPIAFGGHLYGHLSVPRRDSPGSHSLLCPPCVRSLRPFLGARLPEWLCRFVSGFHLLPRCPHDLQDGIFVRAVHR